MKRPTQPPKAEPVIRLLGCTCPADSTCVHAGCPVHGVAKVLRGISNRRGGKTR